MENVRKVKVIVAGSRNFTDFKLLENKLNHLFKNVEPIIISGTANGADKLGAQYARKYGLELIEMPAQWDTYGRSAGYKRNVEMAKVADCCVCFWDNVSKGTKHMIDIAKEYKLNLRIINY